MALDDDIASLSGAPLFSLMNGDALRLIAFAAEHRPLKAREVSAVLRISPMLMRRVLQEFPSTADVIRDALGRDLVELTGGLDRVRRRLLAIGPTPVLPAVA